MNTENQKKWFIYIGDHHQGPFTAEEVAAKKNSGEVTSESYVWCEGMADWQQISTVAELRAEPKADLKTELKSEKPPKTGTQSTIQIAPQSESKQSNPKPLKPKTNPAKILAVASATLLTILIIILGTLALISRSASDDVHASLRPTLIKVVDRFPIFSAIFKLVPSLNDISDVEQKELEQAQIGLPENGVKIAFALSQADANRPYFYISTNLPHQTKLDLHLVGNSETLLNRLQFSTHTTVTVLHGFARTDVFSAEGGQPIPKGEYQVFVTESADQEESIRKAIAEYQPSRVQMKLPTSLPTGNLFLFAKTYFMGGPRDETYLTRLKAFHEKIKQNSEKELGELRQYVDTLQLQFTTLNQEFNRLSKFKKVTPPVQAAWKKTSETWHQINGQLDQTIQTWTKETLDNEFFYGSAYSLVKNAYETIKNLFALENSFFETPGSIDRASFEIQHGKVLSEARDAIEQLRTKVEMIMNAPKTPSGLPTREGL